MGGEGGGSQWNGWDIHADRIARPMQVATAFARGVLWGGEVPAKEEVCVLTLPGCDVPFPPVEGFKLRNPLVPTGVCK